MTAERGWPEDLYAVDPRSASKVPAAASKVPTAASKVPQIIALFWIIKVLSTAQGEAAADFLYFRYGAVVAGTLGFLALVITLALQFSVRRYMAWIYWSAVVMVAIFGTMAADGLHLKLHIPYRWTTLLFAFCLAVIFIAWYATEKTLSIHSICTRRREAFYWATVMATFALGTALGDLTAVPFHLGYLGSTVLFAVVIAIPAVGNWRFGMNPIFAFWFAYVITRPLGASFADYLGISKHLGGLGLGRGPVALVLTVIIVILVGYLAVTRRDVEERFLANPDRRPRHRRPAA